MAAKEKALRCNFNCFALQISLSRYNPHDFPLTHDLSPKNCFTDDPDIPHHMS